MKKLIVAGIALTVAGIFWWARWANDDIANSDSVAPTESSGPQAAIGTVTLPDKDGTEPSPRSEPHTAPDRPGPAFDERHVIDDDRKGTGQVEADDRLHAIRRQAQEADRLEAEAQLLSGESVSVPAMHAALTASDEEFDAIQSNLERQAFDDPLATELTDIYRQFMDSGLDGEHGDFGIDRLACGLRLCIGQTSANRALFEAAMAQWQIDNGPPMFTIMEVPFYDEFGAYLGSRFVFSTDPENNSVEVPIGFQPPESENPTPPEDPEPGG